MTETFFRKGIRWAKVSGGRGKWAVAQGWKGKFNADRTFTMNTKALAVEYARGWVNDQ